MICITFFQSKTICKQQNVTYLFTFMLAQASAVSAFVTINANASCTFMPNFCIFLGLGLTQ